MKFSIANKTTAQIYFLEKLHILMVNAIMAKPFKSRAHVYIYHRDIENGLLSDSQQENKKGCFPKCQTSPLIHGDDVMYLNG